MLAPKAAGCKMADIFLRQPRWEDHMLSTYEWTPCATDRLSRLHILPCPSRVVREVRFGHADVGQNEIKRTAGAVTLVQAARSQGHQG